MNKRNRIISIFLILSITISVLAWNVSASEIDTLLNSKYMILVNRTHRLPSDYVPSDLVNFAGSNYQLEKTCASALQNLINGCKESTRGETLVLYSGYRSYQTQYNKYHGKINQYIANGYSKSEAQRLTDQYYAPPGGSEHHTGLAADICIPSIVNRYGQLHESFGNTTEGKWLRNNAWKYGFILRYDQGNEKITGYNYEPWHFRYVGLAQAKAIFQSGLTFEEYIEQLSDINLKISSPPKMTVKNGTVVLTAPIGSEIRFTTNGKKPTAASTKYTAPLNITNKTYKASVFYKGYSSDFLTITITPYGDVFTDIATSDWYYSIISDTVNQKLFQGMGNHQFMPNKTMNRAMMVQVLANISGADLSKYRNLTSYADVKKTAWYAPAIEWATKNNIVQGMGNHKFEPDAPITREQACVIFYNHSGSTQVLKDTRFSDAKTISKWAKNGVNYCASKKIINGYPDGTFRPKNSATRAEIAKISLIYHSQIKDRAD